MIKGLHHNAYRYRDSEETRAFYEDFLGLRMVSAFEINEGRAIHTFFEMDDGSCLAFFEVPGSPFDFKRQDSLDLHIALGVEPETFDAMLDKAKAGKSITLYKTPSKDDLDAIIIGMANDKKAFGFNLDLYAIYPKSKVHFVHFFQEDATIIEAPVRVGGGKDLLLKIRVALPKADLRRAPKQDGQWVDDDDWIK